MKQGIVKNVLGYLHLKIVGMITKEFVEVYLVQDKSAHMALVKLFVLIDPQDEFVLIGLLEKSAERLEMDVVTAKDLIKVLVTALKLVAGESVNKFQAQGIAEW